MLFENQLRNQLAYKLLEHIHETESSTTLNYVSIEYLRRTIQEEEPEAFELFHNDKTKQSEIKKFERLIKDCDEELANNDISDRVRRSIQSAKEMFEERLKEIK